MAKQKIKIENLIAKLIYLLYIVEAVGISIPPYRSFMISLSPFVFMLSAMMVLFYELKEGNYGFFLWGIIVFLFIFIVVSIGVKTGLVFGRFSFGPVLGSKVNDVPLIIIVNWLFLITGASILASYAEKGLYLTPLLVSVLVLLLLLVLEPAGIKLGYWNWENNLISLQSYYGWMLLTYFISFTYYFYNVSNRSVLPVKFFIIQTLFFSFLFWIL